MSPADYDTGLLNIFCDREGYSGSHGRAYKAYGVDSAKGAVVVVRPDQCEYCV